MEQAARNAPLQTRSAAGRSLWQVVNRIAIEELEAWYFGDWAAVRSAYPRVNKTIAQQSAYRNPDAVAGGTWEAFETTLRRSGYFKGGLRKIEVARELGSRIVPSRNISPSFAVFWHAIKEAMLPA
jgi:hypothetical protein